MSSTINPSGYLTDTFGTSHLTVGPTSCKVVDNTLHISESWQPHQVFTVAETVRVNESVVPNTHKRLAETLHVSEQYDLLQHVNVAETLHVAESVRLQQTQRPTVIETVRVSEGFDLRRTYSVAETVHLTEQYARSRSYSQIDALHVTETVKPLAHHIVTVVETPIVAEKWIGVRKAIVAETLHLSEQVKIARGWNVSESLHLSESLRLVNHPKGSPSDILTVSESWIVSAQPRTQVSEELFVAEQWSLPGVGINAWTACTDTLAMSRYTNYPINSQAVIGGIVYGAGAAGLYRLDADSDDAGFIDAFIKTGEVDLGSEQTKRMRALYAGATVTIPSKAIAALKAIVHDNSYGVVGSNTFPFELRSAADFAPQRAKLGRGMRSRYWQFTIENVSGSDFTIDTLSLVEDTGSRRV